MSLVCLDTNIIKWSVLGEVPDTENPELLTSRSRALMQYLNDKNSEFLLPTVVLGELLVRIPPTEHHEVLEHFDKSWRIADYGMDAARKFAEIRLKMKEIRSLDAQQGNSSSIARCVLSPDAMIAATAIVNEVNVIYTGDEDFVKLARDFIDIRYLLDWAPPVEQQNLWN